MQDDRDSNDDENSNDAGANEIGDLKGIGEIEEEQFSNERPHLGDGDTLSSRIR